MITVAWELALRLYLRAWSRARRKLWRLIIATKVLILLDCMESIEIE
jgi:hypothetical protein